MTHDPQLGPLTSLHLARPLASTFPLLSTSLHSSRSTLSSPTTGKLSRLALSASPTDNLGQPLAHLPLVTTTSFALSPCGNLAVWGTSDGSFRLVDCSQDTSLAGRAWAGVAQERVSAQVGHRRAVSAIAFDPQGSGERWASVGEEGSVGVWGREGRVWEATIPLRGVEKGCLVRWRQGTIVVGMDDGACHVWTAVDEPQQALTTVEADGDQVDFVALDGPTRFVVHRAHSPSFDRVQLEHEGPPTMTTFAGSGPLTAFALDFFRPPSPSGDQAFGQRPYLVAGDSTGLISLFDWSFPPSRVPLAPLRTLATPSSSKLTALALTSGVLIADSYVLPSPPPLKLMKNPAQPRRHPPRLLPALGHTPAHVQGPYSTPTRDGRRGRGPVEGRCDPRSCRRTGRCDWSESAQLGDRGRGGQETGQGWREDEREGGAGPLCVLVCLVFREPSHGWLIWTAARTAEYDLRLQVRDSLASLSSEAASAAAARARDARVRTEFNLADMTEAEAVAYALLLSAKQHELEQWSPAFGGDDLDMDGLSLDDAPSRPFGNRERSSDSDADDDAHSLSVPSSPFLRGLPTSSSSPSRAGLHSWRPQSAGSSSSKIQLSPRLGPTYAQANAVAEPVPELDMTDEGWPVASSPRSPPSPSPRPFAGSVPAQTPIRRGWNDVARSASASPSPSPVVAKSALSARIEREDDELRFAIELSLAEERSRVDFGGAGAQ